MNTRLKVLSLLFVVFAAHCNNIGFVEKAKAAANGEFGFEMFVIGANAVNGNFLLGPDATFTPACTGISGIAKANCICQNEASGRQFTGKFRAWLSISGTVDAICNIQGIESQNCSADSGLGPFLLRTQSGYVVQAENYAELTATGVRSQIENPGKLIYSGSQANGRSSGSDCTGFTVATGGGTGGQSGQSGTGFATGQGLVCGTPPSTSFICMKQSK